jgi:hypothetical protein
MCTSNYRWKNDWLICDCDQKLGFKYIVTNDNDEPETKVFLNYPYSNMIDKEGLIN